MIDYIKLIKSNNCRRGYLFQYQSRNCVTLVFKAHDGRDIHELDNPDFDILRTAARLNKLLTPGIEVLRKLNHNYTDAELNELKLLKQ